MPNRLLEAELLEIDPERFSEVMITTGDEVMPDDQIVEMFRRGREDYRVFSKNGIVVYTTEDRVEIYMTNEQYKELGLGGQ